MAKKKRAFRNPNGYGSVVKLGGQRRKPYASRVTTGWHDGKQIFKYIGYYEKREDAMAALADFNRGLLTLDTNTVTFKEWGERWFEMCTVEMSDTSINQYRKSFQNCESLFNLRMVDITSDTIQNMLNTNGKSKSTNIQIRSLLKQVFEHAIANKVITFSPVAFVKTRGTEKRVGNRFSEKEVQWLWDNQDKRFVDIMLILVYTGMRVNELLSLPKSAVTLKGRYLIWGSKTKAGKDRVIPISNKILPFFKRRMNLSRTYVIEHKGKKLNYQTFAHSFREYLKLMGADTDHVIHDFRRTTISMLSDAGVALPTIQKIVGHKGDNVTTQVYLNISIETALEAIDKI